MSNPFIPDRLIPAGINDERSRAFVRAFSDEIEAVDMQSLLVQDALTVDERLLPAMTVARAMTGFMMPNMKQKFIRQLLANYHQIHENSGYIYGTRIALLSLGIAVEWTQWHNEIPMGPHDTHKVVVYINENLFEDDENLFSAQNQTAIRRAIDQTQRWSQDVAFSLGVLLRQKIGLANATTAMAIDHKTFSATRNSDSQSNIGLASAVVAIEIQHITFEAVV